MATHCWREHHSLLCLLCMTSHSTLGEMRTHLKEELEALGSRCVLCAEELQGEELMEHLLKSHMGSLVSRSPSVFEERRGGREEVELVCVTRRPRRNRSDRNNGIYLFDNYSCPHCQRKFSAKSGLKIHVGIAHKGGKLLFCPRCPASFSDVASCKAHFREEHGAARRGRRAAQEQEVPRRSLVPSDEPVEGQAGVQGVQEGLGDITLAEVPAAALAEPPAKLKKARRPLPGLVKIQDMERLPPPPPVSAPVTTISQVYVPALTSSGATILMRLEEAQQAMQRGSVTFLPSAQAGGGPPILGTQQQILLAPRQQPASVTRDKVALNLPVVMTKRTNKKVAQDNPFFQVQVQEGELSGECRVCAASFLFSQSAAMEAHYKAEHGQDLRIHTFPLYYQITHRDKDGVQGRQKFFLCFYCGKEFTTK